MWKQKLKAFEDNEIVISPPQWNFSCDSQSPEFKGEKRSKLTIYLRVYYQPPTILSFLLVDPDDFLQETKVISAHSVCLIKI